MKVVNEKEKQEELASRYTEVEDKLEAQARKLMVACSENTQDLKKLHSKEEMANIQTGIPRLLLRGKSFRLVSGGERIHQALARKGAQPPVLPFASFLASCGDLFFSAHDGSVLHCIQYKRADDCSHGECVNCSPAKAIKMGLVSKNRSRTALAGYKLGQTL